MSPCNILSTVNNTCHTAVIYTQQITHQKPFGVDQYHSFIRSTRLWMKSWIIGMTVIPISSWSDVVIYFWYIEEFTIRIHNALDEGE